MTEHRIVSTQFTAYTAAVECSCGSTVSHLGLDRAKVLANWRWHAALRRQAERAERARDQVRRAQAVPRRPPGRR
jgi:hypothetical protein